jgi:hypothetical protein
MYISKLATIFFLASIKLMFVPIAGSLMGLSFLETYLSVVLGGIFTAAIFYFSANYFMHRAKHKRDSLRKEQIANGIPILEKRKFTRMNKGIVKVKMTLGIYGTALWAPLFLSVPLGSIITAKFFGNDKRTFLIIILGMFINCAVTTGIVYIF